jgi:hypothetical protein
MKWNLRWVAAKRDIWRPTDLLAAFREVGFNPSLSKVAAPHTADPVHLSRLFGIHPSTAVKYVNAAHPDKALPRVR